VDGHLAIMPTTVKDPLAPPACGWTGTTFENARQGELMNADLAAGITQELRAFVAAAGTRRGLPTTCHVGHPGGEKVGLAWVEDAGLRPDLVVRAIEGLATTGEAVGAWFAAARHGFARHDLSLPAFAVVTRTAWVDLVSGERREWRRVRTRRRAA
jgi:hypothetical protein